MIYFTYMHINFLLSLHIILRQTLANRFIPAVTSNIYGNSYTDLDSIGVDRL
jgi:hypothetical protein